MALRGRSYFNDENCFFVTTTVINHLNVFSSPNACEILIKNIKYYQEKYHFQILAYVIMPSHFHWIITTDNEFGTISDIMRDLKKYSAWDIMDFIQKSDENKFMKYFEGAGEKYKGQKRKFWQERFDDVILKSRKFFLQKLNYIHNNPVKAGIVDNPEDYTYSSARNYKYSDHSVIYVETDVL
ncbi:MAG TPA: transposase [Candidatus Cloacimonetes bacterium]|nr:transposase [Candidatus Cloacimonadota bacterium]HEX37433.1 transposase [Candidatus Cloacimonadota bacterium]